MHVHLHKVRAIFRLQQLQCIGQVFDGPTESLAGILIAVGQVALGGQLHDHGIVQQLLEAGPQIAFGFPVGNPVKGHPQCLGGIWTVYVQLILDNFQDLAFGRNQLVPECLDVFIGGGLDPIHQFGRTRVLDVLLRSRHHLIELGF